MAVRDVHDGGFEVGETRLAGLRALVVVAILAALAACTSGGGKANTKADSGSRTATDSAAPTSAKPAARVCGAPPDKADKSTVLDGKKLPKPVSTFDTAGGCAVYYA